MHVMANWQPIHKVVSANWRLIICVVLVNLEPIIELVFLTIGGQFWTIAVHQRNSRGANTEAPIDTYFCSEIGYGNW